MSLLVSIHDVTPALGAGVLRLWKMCAARPLAGAAGGPRLARRLAARASSRVRAVAARAGVGRAEIVLHGERHSSGEFRALDRAAARVRIDRGLGSLRALGLEPAGFVPPAWQARAGGHAAVGEAGLGFSEDERSIRLFPADRRVVSPAVRWSARTAVRAWGSVAVARGRWLLQRRAWYPRVAFHPQDYVHHRTARDLPAPLDRWLSRHTPISYATLRDTEFDAPDRLPPVSP